MITAKQKKIINDTWQKMEYVLNNQSISHYADRYYEQNLQEEKDHSKFMSRYGSRGMTIPQAARLFCVRQIAEYLKEPKKTLDAKDFISYRQSIFWAYSLANTYRAELTEALKGVDLDAILALDYADLVE